MQFSAFVFSCCFSVVFTFSFPFVRFYRFFCSAQPLLAWRGGSSVNVTFKNNTRKNCSTKIRLPRSFFGSSCPPSWAGAHVWGTPLLKPVGVLEGHYFQSEKCKESALKIQVHPESQRRYNVGTTLVRRWSDVATTLDRRFFIQVHQGRVPNNIYDSILRIKLLIKI